MDRQWGEKPLPFLAVGRVKDGVTLAWETTAKDDTHKEQTKDVFTKLLQAASNKLAKGQRTRLQWNEGSVCCIMDQKGILLYCVVTSLLTYPERLAYQLLYDLQQDVQRLDNVETAKENALNETLGGRMRELIAKYEDSSRWPHAINVNRTSVQSESSLQQPSAISLQARNARRHKMMIGIAAVLAGIIILIIVFANLGKGKKKE
mmetsp:Transcript_72854/g.115319  ORF Transcript_72854/g.115319 Transcript_72854/m.115319 type:complete len:205 (+) Transcript_72854:67-681(+)